MAEKDYLSLDDMYEYYRLHGGEILGYLINKGFDREAAEDLMHDTFLKACNQVSRGTVYAENVRAWLFRIAHNTAISRFRKKKEILQVFRDPVGEDPAVKSDDKLVQEEILRFVASSFSPKEGEVFHFRIVLGFTYQETADILQMSKTTVIRIDENNINRIKARFGDIR